MKNPKKAMIDMNKLKLIEAKIKARYVRGLLMSLIQEFGSELICSLD